MKYKILENKYWGGFYYILNMWKNEIYENFYDFKKLDYINSSLNINNNFMNKFQLIKHLK